LISAAADGTQQVLPICLQCPNVGSWEVEVIPLEVMACREVLGQEISRIPFLGVAFRD